MFQAEMASQIADYEDLKLDDKDLLAQTLLAGLDLSAEKDKRFRQLIEQSPKFQRTKTVIKTWYRQGIEEGEQKGKQKGEQKGKQELILLALSSRFPSKKITVRVQNQLKRMDSQKLDQLIVKLMDPSQTLESLGLVNGVAAQLAEKA